MSIDDVAVGDREALGLKRFQAQLIGSRRDGPLDAGGQQILKGGEQRILEVDGERQHTIEEGGDRRQLVLEAGVVAQAETRRLLEGEQRAAFDLARIEQPIELAQGVARILRFEIVLRPEQPLAAGLTLAARDRAQRVEPAGDGRDEPLLRLHVGRHRPEQRRLLLIGSVGAAEALDCVVGLPARLQQIVDAQPLVPRAEVGVIAAPRSARIGEDQDALGVALEGVGLADIGRARTALDDKTVDAV